MQGTWNNGKPHYRCMFRSEYAAKNKVSHPTSVYLREEQVLPRLDDWLSCKFGPDVLALTVRELEDAQPEEPKPAEAALREIAECDAKLRQHRAALEAGADPVLVTSWINETQARHAAAEARLRKPAGRRHMTREEITNPVTALGDVIQVLKRRRPGRRGGGLQPTWPDADLPPAGQARGSRSATGNDHVRRKVSEGDSEPIAHASSIALTTAFILGGAQ
jgi:hypothetical protein